MYLEEQAKIIEDYIRDGRYKQDVLISGAWGVGKTFFVQNFLLPKFEDYNIIWCSLYGARSAEQIKLEVQQKIIIKAVENKEFKIKRKKYKIPAKLLNVAPEAISIIWKKIGLESEDLNAIINQINIDNNKILLIFDDLERSNLEINEVLGIINSYVECKKFKVIIIANENEIGSARISCDLPEKYLVASNAAIKLEGKANSDRPQTQTYKTDVYSYEDLLRRTKILFSNDIIYNSIKEKLVGLTVTIYADFHSLYETVVETNARCSKSFLLSNKETVIEIFQSTDCQNLRTLIFAIITFDKLYEIIAPSITKDLTDNYKMLVDKELCNILKSVVFVSIKYQSGKVSSKNKSHTPSMTYTFLFNGVKEYRFVNEYIIYHEVKNAVDEFKSQVLDSIEMYKDRIKKDTLSFYRLNSFEWINLDDDQVIELTNTLFDELKNEEYDVRFFRDIVIYLLQLNEHFKEKKNQLSHNDDEYIQLMVDYINKHDSVNNQIGILEGAVTDSKYTEYILPLIIATEEKNNCSTNARLKELFESSDWALKFYDYCGKHRDKFFSSRSFLSSFDISLLLNALSSASNNDMREIVHSICSIYDFGNIYEFYKSDIPALEKIIELLNKKYQETNVGCTTKHVIDSCLTKLNEKMKLLKREI